MTKTEIQKKPYRRPLCTATAVQGGALLRVSGVRVGDRQQVEGATDAFTGVYDIEMADESHSKWGEVEVD